ncbi:hypothetical protein R3I94_005688 [Phoxinus phoxinus]
MILICSVLTFCLELR